MKKTNVKTKPTKKQEEVLRRLGLLYDWATLTDDEFFEIDEAVYNELVTYGINDTGDGLNDYGELCRSILVDLPDDE